MKKIIVLIILLLTIASSLSGFVIYSSNQSVCSLTGLSGPEQQENMLYCANGTNIAPSTYREVISLAGTKHMIAGTPEFVTETVDWAGCPITDVEFTRGFHAEHHNVGNACNNDLLVRIYSPEGIRVWP